MQTSITEEKVAPSKWQCLAENILSYVLVTTYNASKISHGPARLWLMLVRKCAKCGKQEDKKQQQRWEYRREFTSVIRFLLMPFKCRLSFFWTDASAVVSVRKASHSLGIWNVVPSWWCYLRVGIRCWGLHGKVSLESLKPFLFQIYLSALCLNSKIKRLPSCSCH